MLALRCTLAAGLGALGLAVEPGPGFDTLSLPTAHPGELVARALAGGFNLRPGDAAVGISLDELTDGPELDRLLAALAVARESP